MVDDPSEHPELFPTEEDQENERQRLFRLIEELVKWENTTNEKVLNQAHEEIWNSWRYTCEKNKNHPLTLRSLGLGFLAGIVASILATLLGSSPLLRESPVLLSYRFNLYCFD